MIRNLWNESWKAVVFDDAILESEKYKVSNYGRLIKVLKQEEVLIEKQYTINNYYTVAVTKKDGKKTSRYIHKLIAYVFLEKPENAKFVIHLDYDKFNNNLSNLKWVTKREKEIHQFKNPFYKERGKFVSTSKLTVTHVMRLKKILNNPKRNIKLKILARQFNVSETQIRRIKSGENWGHIKV